jgi:hypothetical protein
VCTAVVEAGFCSVRRLTAVWCPAAAPGVPAGPYAAAVPYSPRPQLRSLLEFAGTALSRPDPAVQARVERFVLEQYAVGRSLREIAELTDRSFSAVRNILDKHGVQRRASGAAPHGAEVE